MKVISRRKQRELAKELEDCYLNLSCQYADQEKVARYLNSLPFRFFQDTIEKNIGHAFEVAHQIKADGEKEPGRQLRLLHRILEMPKPFYRGSQKDGSKSARLFGSALTYAQKDVRHALLPETIELDMCNAQLAILNGLWYTPSVHSILTQGCSIWPELLNWLAIPEEYWKKAKPYVKEALYSLIYGMRKYIVEKRLTDGLLKENIWKRRSLIKNPIIHEVSETIMKAKQQIEEKGYAESAYGRMEWRAEENINSFLSCLIQSYEFSLITSVYDVAIDMKKSFHDDFSIVLHQHDGFSIMLKPGAKEEVVVKRLERAVARKAEEWNIVVKLAR